MGYDLPNNEKALVKKLKDKTMVVLKYRKTEEGKFFSHLNMLRLWNRLVSIARIEVKYTEGFNKTRKLYFSSPTRVGVDSFCEYIVIDTSEEAEDVEEKLENILPHWLEILKAFDVEKKFNIPALNSRAKYKVSFDEYKAKKEKVKEFFEKDTIVIPVIAHGERKEVDVKNRIFDVKLQEKELEITCGVGNESVRIDEVVKLLKKELSLSQNDWSIKKEVLYLTDDEGEIYEVDEYLDKIKIEE